MKRIAAGCLAGALALVAASVQAQTIYPLTRAEILAGTKFDLKVEFPQTPEQAAVKVNGQDAASVLGKAATFTPREDGGDYSAYWIRDVSLAKPGKYTVEAAAGSAKSTVVWE